MSPRPLVHIGHHKTGSTWLQQGLFLNREAGFSRPWTRRFIEETLVEPDGLAFDMDSAREAFAGGRRDADAAGTIAVASHERLGGSVFSGGYDLDRLASRLHGVFPDARVLLVIREQRSMIRSAYAQYVREGGTAPLKRFLEPIRMSPHVPVFEPAFLAYDRIVARYRELFGSDAVLVLPFELLARDPSTFVARIVAFCEAAEVPVAGGAPSNTGMPDAGVAIKRQLNRLVASSLNQGGVVGVWRAHGRLNDMVTTVGSRLPDAVNRSLRDRTERVVDDFARGRYGTSNQRVAALTGLDLSALGYDVGQ